MVYIVLPTKTTNLVLILSSILCPIGIIRFSSNAIVFKIPLKFCNSLCLIVCAKFCFVFISGNYEKSHQKIVKMKTIFPPKKSCLVLPKLKANSRRRFFNGMKCWKRFGLRKLENQPSRAIWSLQVW